MAWNFKLCLPFLRICLLGHKIAATYHFVLTFDLKIAKLRHYDCYFWVVNKRDAISEKPFDRNCEGSEKNGCDNAAFRHHVFGGSSHLWSSAQLTSHPFYVLKIDDVCVNSSVAAAVAEDNGVAVSHTNESFFCFQHYMHLDGSP